MRDPRGSGTGPIGSSPTLKPRSVFASRPAFVRRFCLSPTHVDTDRTVRTLPLTYARESDGSGERRILTCQDGIQAVGVRGKMGSGHNMR